jgi:hypothetical protein
MRVDVLRIWFGVNLGAGLLLGSIELGVLISRWMFW